MRYTVNDMSKLKALFQKHDADNSGTLDIDEFYNLFETKKNPFGDALFRMVTIVGWRLLTRGFRPHNAALSSIRSTWTGTGSFSASASS